MSSRRDLANAIRFLSIDAVQQAKSGHPGMPMGMADMAEVLWNDFLRHNPTNPDWANRDRFVLSNGHGSMLLYSLLHLTGYDIDIDEIRNFRQLHSKTPGHPEYAEAPGVETTTGPLGQGLANAVGMAIAERSLAAEFNKPGHNIIDHHTYVFVGDGCLMEGISHEACSLAGTLGLGKLIVLYDDNGISIDGEVEAWFADDTAKRFEAYGWQVVRDVDGHNPESIHGALTQAKSNTSQPTLICCKTQIGFGSPNKANTSGVHGAPLGDDEIKLVREQLNWPHDRFVIPDDMYQAWSYQEQGEALEAEWQRQFDQYQKTHPELAATLLRRLQGDLPANWPELATDAMKAFDQKAEKVATRKASLNCLEAIGSDLPELLGGSADLTGSNLTKWSGSKAITHDEAEGNYIYYGVREFGMSAIMNGIALHGGFIPYGGTFLTFTDYARNAVRMAALMHQRVIHVYTHDSIGLGEDGPTHQPVEHAAMLRITPNVSVWRPCDAVETFAAWSAAIENNQGPTCLLLSRQGLPHQARSAETLANMKRGGYILKDCAGEPEAILIATGSEVELAMAAAEQLSDKNIRVVSMPCTDMFDKQDAAYKESVLPAAVASRIAIEAASSDYWYKYVGLEGKIIGMEGFGASAPADVLFNEFGFSVENIVNEINDLIEE